MAQFTELGQYFPHAHGRHSPNYVPAEVSITVIFKQGENMSTVTVLSMTHYHTSLEKDESLRYPASYAASSGCYRNNYSQAP